MTESKEEKKGEGKSTVTFTLEQSKDKAEKDAEGKFGAGSTQEKPSSDGTQKVGHTFFKKEKSPYFA